MRARVCSNEKPEVRAVLIPFWERLKQEPHGFSFIFVLPVLLPSGGFEAVECSSAYFLYCINWKKKHYMSICCTSIQMCWGIKGKKNKNVSMTSMQEMQFEFFFPSLSVRHAMCGGGQRRPWERAATVTSQKPTQHPILPTLPAVRHSVAAVRGLKRAKNSENVRRAGRCRSSQHVAYSKDSHDPDVQPGVARALPSIWNRPSVHKTAMDTTAIKT